MPAPLFSVVIPIYNKEKYLQATLKSVFAQRFGDYEVILILDPSSDRSAEIAHAHKNNRTRIFNRDIAGPGGYAARNLGIKEAVGEWITFLDADDLWYDNHLQVLSSAIERRGGEHDVFCTGYVTERDGRISESQYLKRFGKGGSHSFDFESFLLHKPLNTINSAIRRNKLLAIGGFPESGFKRGADHETWLRLLALVRGGYWLSEPTAIYNKNVEDGVIKSSLPYTVEHPVLIKVRELLRSEHDPKIAAALKSYSNSFVITGVKRRLKMGMLKVEDVNALYVEQSKNKVQWTLFRMFAQLPFAIQRIVAQLLYVKKG